MDINYLREFVVLAQTCNFMEAADILYSSQSTLSKHIKVIEKELGIPLFIRTTRKVKISKYGQLLLPYAKQIVELEDKYSTVLQKSIEIESETLAVGSIPALAPYNITDVLVNFKKSRPQSTVNIVQTGSEELKEMLRQKKCEIAFIRFADEVDDDLIKRPYAVDNMVAILPATHSISGRKTIPLQMLSKENFLLIEKDTMLYELCIDACRRSGFEPKIAYTDHRLENLVEMIISGMGVALLMKPLALYISNSKISIVDVTPSVSTEINICYLKDIKLSDTAKHFLQCAESQSTNFALLSQSETRA